MAAWQWHYQNRATTATLWKRQGMGGYFSQRKNVRHPEGLGLANAVGVWLPLPMVWDALLTIGKI
ncbi:hypothetical protein OOZ15_20065, partial [Galbibacter sp. EGI 63066]|uniref:hypothetical protein n=1 Tax=Galbibacter sp. EGI 63066 TaxID=2993559 RepID=UPI002248CA3E